MRVEMLEDAPGSPDGVTVNQYDGGVVYEVADALGIVFVANGHAVETITPVVLVSDPDSDDGTDDVEQSKPKQKRGRGKTIAPTENK